jgi:glutamate carboxypeptidase
LLENQQNLNSPLVPENFHRDKDLLFLKNLVNRDSQTKNSEGVDIIQGLVIEHLKHLHFEIERILSPGKMSGDLVIATYRGKSEECITLICHADTVLAPDEQFQFRFDDKMNRFYGPGIADNKAGIVCGLIGLRNFLKENPLPEYTIKFVCSPNEERGSLGFHQHFQTIGEKSTFAFGLEPALSSGNIISSRNGNRWYKFNLKGISSHAGRIDSPSLNAAHEMSLAIAKMVPLNNLEIGVKVNIGNLSGGADVYNVVCGDITAKIDTRFPSFELRDELCHKIEKIFKERELRCHITNKTCDSNFEISDDCPPMPKHEGDGEVIQFYLSTINKLEKREISATHSCGAADVNYFATKYNITLDGLGPVGGNLHTKNEYIELKSFFGRSQGIGELLRHINMNKKTNKHTQGE